MEKYRCRRHHGRSRPRGIVRSVATRDHGDPGDAPTIPPPLTEIADPARPSAAEEARTIGERIEGPLFYFMLAGTASMGMTLAELGQLGYRIVCDATTPLLARQKALRLCYEALAQGLPDPTLAGAYKEEDRLIHQTIELEKLLAVERRTVER